MANRSVSDVVAPADAAPAPAAVKRTAKPQPPEAPWYRVLMRSYLNGRLYEAGEEVQYAGKPGQYLEHVRGTPWAASSPPTTDKPKAV